MSSPDIIMKSAPSEVAELSGNAASSGTALDVQVSKDVHLTSDKDATAAAPRPRRPFFKKCISAFDPTKGCAFGGGSSSAYLVSKGRKFDATQMDIPSEDACAVATVGNNELVCLADGHGGTVCSHFMVDHLLRQMREAVAKGSPITDSVMGEIFRAADPSWSVAECCDASGTTATLAIANAYELTVAHVGDSLALLITADADGVLHGQFITKAHVASDADEAAQVKARGGHIEVSACDEEPARVNGELEVTRALGDVSLKPYVSSTPDVSTMKVTKDMRLLIIASDGLWDQVSLDDVLRECKRSDPKAVAQQLAKQAYAQNGRPDDISVYVHLFNDTSAQGPSTESTPLPSTRSEPPSNAPPTPPLLSPRPDDPAAARDTANTAPSPEVAIAIAAADAIGGGDGAIVVAGSSVTGFQAGSTSEGNKSSEAVAPGNDGDALPRTATMSLHLPVAHGPGRPAAGGTSFLDTASTDRLPDPAEDTVLDLRSALTHFSAYEHAAQHCTGLVEPTDADRVALAKMWEELRMKASARVERRVRRRLVRRTVGWGLCVAGALIGGVLVAQGILRSR